ncbi:MAG: cysteine hydrolase [Nitrospira sp.]|nr:cysteine hydrolase [Nitrospira sp.]
MNIFLRFRPILIVLIFVLQESTTAQSPVTYSYPKSSAALLLVDPYNDFISDGGKLWGRVKETAEALDTVNNLIRLSKIAREQGIKVIYVPHHQTQAHDYDGWKFKNPAHRGIERGSIFEKGSWGAEFHPSLKPLPGDLIAEEHWTSSGFANTDLDMLLKQHGIDHVVIAGIRANTCVESTGRYAVELGYHTTLISDAIAAFNWDEIKAAAEINFPAFGHAVMTTDEFISGMNANQ